MKNYWLPSCILLYIPLVIILCTSCKKEDKPVVPLREELQQKSDTVEIEPQEHKTIVKEGTANDTLTLLNEDALNKIAVNLNQGDSLLRLRANMKMDHRIFGYAAPDVNSEKLVLFSIFTNEIKNNPFHCKLGAYYEISASDGYELKYSGTTGAFVKAFYKTSLAEIPVYFEKKWIEMY